MSRGKRKSGPIVDPATLAFEGGRQLVSAHPIFGGLMLRADVVRPSPGSPSLVPRDGWAKVFADGTIHVHPTRRGEPGEWAYVLAHCLLHLGFDHFRDPISLAWAASCDAVIARFLEDIGFGCAPMEMQITAALEGLPGRDERSLERAFENRVPPLVAQLSLAGSERDMEAAPPRVDWFGKSVNYPEVFAAGLNEQLSQAVIQASGRQETLKNTTSEKAKRWFISSFPLLGALAAAFEVIEDAAICGRMGIQVAAVDVRRREIYINPIAGLNEAQCRFVMAHEILHAALRHDARLNGRDPYFWNVACDFVINDWLLEMAVGDPPPLGMLHDPELRGMSAEAIYDLLTTDLRHYRKLQTLCGVGKSDILPGDEDQWWKHGAGVSLDAWYRGALSQGLAYHEERGRGLLPAGLVEEIRALEMPVVPWDVQLAYWFDARFMPLERKRSYARLSRRQSATPDIPRPALVVPEEARRSRVFGVVLDTSGSMERSLLAKALGTIASYAMAHDVVAVRVIFCDATAYDAGWMAPEEMAGRVRVRGRGGTILQPGVRMLETANDFPETGPILILTDAQCEDSLACHRDHAFVVPIGARLPFRPNGPVFAVR